MVPESRDPRGAIDFQSRHGEESAAGSLGLPWAASRRQLRLLETEAALAARDVREPDASSCRKWPR